MRSTSVWGAIARSAARGGGLLGLAACAPLPCEVSACDIREASCQDSIMRSTACLREQPMQTVPVEVMHRDVYASRLAQTVATEQTEAARLNYERVQRAFALLALEDARVGAAGIAQGQAATTGAFYDSEADQVVVLHGGEQLNSLEYSATLAHEFAHALQLRQGQLALEGIDSVDELLAALAVIEGDASWTDDRYFALGAGRDPAELDWEEILQRWTQQSERFYQSQRSRVRLASRFFVYAFGQRFVYDYFEQGGQAGIDALYERLPSASIDVVLRQNLDRNAELAAVEAVGVAQLQDAELLAVERLGWWVLSRGSALALALNIARVDPDSFRWRGDSISLWYRQADDAVLASLRVRFADEQDAARWGSILEATGLDGALEATVDGSDLMIFASDSDDWLQSVRDTPPSFGAVPNTEDEEAMDASVAALSAGDVWRLLHGG